MKRSRLIFLPILAVLAVPAAGVSARADNGAALRSLIENLCGGCHGAGGVSMRPGVPHLAGQKFAYLETQMRRFRERLSREQRPFRLSERMSHTMNGIAVSLSDIQIAAIAAYYAGLSCINPEPHERPSPVPEIAQRCMRCHGQDGRGGGENAPAIAGQREDYLVQALVEIKASVLAKNKEVMQRNVAPSELPRYHREMGDWAARMNEAEIAAAAAYYATQPCRD